MVFSINFNFPGICQSIDLTAGVAVLAVIVCVFIILCVVVAIFAFMKWKMAKCKLNQRNIIMHKASKNS